MGSFVARQQKSDQKPLARQALGRSKSIFWSVGVFSGFVNALALAGSFYMLQIYDRILPSESVPTLVALTGLLIGLYFVYGALDLVRVRLMGRVGVRFDQDVRPPVYKALHKMPLKSQTSAHAMQPLRDLDQVRAFLSSLGPTAFFDLPWVPIYLAAVYFLHPVLGMLAAGGAVVLVLITAITDIKSAKPTRQAAESGTQRASLSEATRRNAEVIQAMGLAQHLRDRWSAVSDRYLCQISLPLQMLSPGLGRSPRFLGCCCSQVCLEWVLIWLSSIRSRPVLLLLLQLLRRGRWHLLKHQLHIGAGL